MEMLFYWSEVQKGNINAFLHHELMRPVPNKKTTLYSNHWLYMEHNLKPSFRFEKPLTNLIKHKKRRRTKCNNNTDVMLQK